MSDEYPNERSTSFVGTAPLDAHFPRQTAEPEHHKTDAVIDLSYSQILETKSKSRSNSKRRLGHASHTSKSSLLPLNEAEEMDAKLPSGTTGKRNPFQYNSRETNAYDITRGKTEQIVEESQEDDSEWSRGDMQGPGGDDVYRFVQPRRLSSWVQDDAVFACFKCHTPFTLIVRKHHCRACGRIFCNACSNQRLVIPIDYESTPVSHVQQLSTYSYSSALAANASDVIGNLGYYVWSYNNTPSLTSNANNSDFSKFPFGNISSSRHRMRISSGSSFRETHNEVF
jgi:hypothetical protein